MTRSIAPPLPLLVPLAAALLVLVIGLSPARALACSCAGLDGPVEQANAAGVVFVGTVVSVHHPWSLRFNEDSNENLVRFKAGLGSSFGATVETKFEVETAWKGVETRTVVIDTGDGFCCNCTMGRAWDPGERALVFAYAHEGKLHASSCNYPRPAEDAEALVPALGEGYVPGDDAPRAPLGWRSWLAIALGLAVVGGGAYLGWRGSPSAEPPPPG